MKADQSDSQLDEPPEPQMDWQQVALNGGPPCFAFTIGDRYFCGRAEQWAGHGPAHAYVSLAEYINQCAESAFSAKEVLREEITRLTSPAGRGHGPSRAEEKGG
jgi:hypothetical protein